MAGVEAEHLRRLMEAAAEPDVTAAVAVDAGGRMHPLCGVHRRELAGEIGRELAAGERAVWRVVERVCGAGLRRVEFGADVLRNVNAPGDLSPQS
jgi:molybdopterin-guanine dinucleotide biosynthesis protein A